MRVPGDTVTGDVDVSLQVRNVDSLTDRAASALGSAFGVFSSALERGWARESPTAVTYATGLQLAPFNGVRVIRSDCTTAEVRAGLADLARHGLPFSLEVRPGWRQQGREVAAALGMITNEDTPLMVATEAVKAPPVDGLSLRAISPDEAEVHGGVAAPVFGIPPEMWVQFVNDDTFARSEIRGYVGEVDGTAVTTAITVTVDDVVGIFNVATSSAHRGLGYGGAVTALATNEGFHSGASLAWLQASDMGYPVYERIGFETVEWWPGWVSETTE